MSEEAFESNSSCESSSHQQHLCYIVSQGFHLTDEAEYQALIKDPQFKCQKCGRLATKQNSLCKPVELSLNQNDSSETIQKQIMKFKSVDELLDFAIIREIEAQELYIKMAFTVKNPWMSKVLEGFAQEELRHRQRLEAVKANRIVLSRVKVDELEINDALDDSKLHANMDYPELLKYAINKENSSYRLYTSMASIFSDLELKDIFLKLAREEANHMQHLEFENDQVMS